MKQEMNNDLDWVAFLYVAGEMSAEESQAFESRMLEDQSAREAVARSVAMVSATTTAMTSLATSEPELVAAKPEPVRVSKGRSHRVYVFAGIATAACIMLAVALRSGFTLPEGINGVGNKSAIDRSTASLDDLALNWSAVHLDSSAGERATDAVGDEASADRTEPSDSGREEVPNWLLEAVGGKLEPTSDREVLR